LGITFKHFVNTFVDDLKYFPSSALNEEAFARRQGPEGAGLFTVEYPEQKLRTPENFRFIPFLVTDYTVPKDDPNFDQAEYYQQDRCTSCGICAKVCPPQCIWIVRTNDPDTGKPIPQPAEFYIDTDICMNCGYCAEFCPFDAIKMDHDFELADYEREEGHIHDLDRLLKPVTYYASIRPNWYAKEEEAKRQAEEEKRRKEEEKQRRAAEKAAAKAAEAKKGDGKQADGSAPKKKTPEEIKAQREAMLAKKQARAAQAQETAPKTDTTAEQPAKTGVAATPDKSDDLTKIEGIGPVISKTFNAAGISTFSQLAASTPERLKQILDDADLRRIHDPATWPEQAKLAADGKWDELEKLQDELKGGRRV
jgi:NADH-quinone oxidoreductase subunit I